MHRRNAQYGFWKRRTAQNRCYYSAWADVCAGEAALAKFAESYFRNEQKAETPFTSAGAKELLRLEILAIAVLTGCAMAGSIAEGILAGFMQVENTVAMDRYMDNEASIVLGIMFLFGSLLCRYGAEMRENEEK